MFEIFQDLKKVNSYLKSCFLIFPNYNLGHGLMEMAYNEYINEYYAKIGTDEQAPVFLYCMHMMMLCLIKHTLFPGNLFFQASFIR